MPCHKTMVGMPQRQIDVFAKEIDEWLLNFEEWERPYFVRGDRVGEGIYDIPEMELEPGGERARLEVATQLSPPRRIVSKYHYYHPLTVVQDDKELYHRHRREAERWGRFLDSRHVVA